MIEYHYAATIVPFIFLATANTLRFIRKKVRKYVYSVILFIITLTSILNVTHHVPEWKTRMARWRDPHDPARHFMVKNIPPKAGVVATFGFLDTLSQRKYLNAFYNVWLDVNYFTNERPFKFSPNISYALIDFKDPWILQHVFSGPPYITGNIYNFFERDPWYVSHAVEEIVLFQKNHPSHLKLVETGLQPFPEQGKKIGALVENNITLKSVHIDRDTLATNKLLHFIFNWKCEQTVNQHYGMQILLTSKEGVHVQRYRNIGYTIFPTKVWSEGNHIKEHYWLQLPKLAKGEYTIQLVFINNTQERQAEVRLSSPETAPSKSLIIGNLVIE